MPEHIVVAKMILCLIGIGVSGYHEGVGAYYHRNPGLMKQVCEWRVSEGWNPDLDCSVPCLAAALYEKDIGRYVLADLPGLSFTLCHIVDCASEEHIKSLLDRGEVIEIDYFTAEEAGWKGFVDGVKLWRLGDESN